jgi:hypothetical protein
MTARFVYRKLEGPEYEVKDHATIERLRADREGSIHAFDPIGSILEIIEQHVDLKRDDDFCRMMRGNFGFYDGQYWEDIRDLVVEQEIVDAYNMVKENQMDYEEGHENALRLLIEWMLVFDHRLMKLVLDKNILDVGDMLLTEKHTRYSGGCRTSLIGIAALDCQSVEAVRFLISQGADPSGILNKTVCDHMGYDLGAEAVAIHELCGDWTPDSGYAGRFYGNQNPSSAAEIIEVLLEAGSLHTGKDKYMYHSFAELFLTEELKRVYAAHDQRKLKKHKQLWINAVAALGIVSAWRRLTWDPDSNASKQVVKRLKTAAGQPV